MNDNMTRFGATIFDLFSPTPAHVLARIREMEAALTSRMRGEISDEDLEAVLAAPEERL